MGYEKVNPKSIYSTKIFALVNYDFIRNGEQYIEGMSILESNDAANAFILTEENQVILVEQYRFGGEITTLELPGGLVEDAELAYQGVQRELREETGFEAENWTEVGFVYGNPVYQNNRILHYFADNGKQVASQDLDPAEDIIIHRMPFEELVNLYFEGQVFRHPHAISGIHYALQHMRKTNHPLAHLIR